MSGWIEIPEGGANAYTVTTTTPGRFEISARGIVVGEMTISEPASTTQGKLEVTFRSRSHGSSFESKSEKDFFINPSSPGTYTWAPSLVSPRSGPPVTMDPRPGFSQTVTIVGTGQTTVVTTAETAIPTVTQTTAATTVQVTTVPQQTTMPQTTAQTTSRETETEATAQTPRPSGQFPMEFMVAGALLIVVVAAGVILIVRRKK